GPERAEYERQIRGLGLDSIVTVTGYLTGEELNTALTRVHALVMPSVCEETAGLAAMEQMMRARLVIASDGGGRGEVVGDSGLKFKVNDVAGLAACMRSVVENPTLIREMGARARERAVRLFQRETMLAAHAEIYRMCQTLKLRKSRVLG